MKKLRTNKTKEIPPKLGRKPVASLYEQYLELLWLRQQIEAAGINKRRTPSQRAAHSRRRDGSRRA
jgi:hypothetical protein